MELKKIGFIGFGEASFGIAKGLKESGYDNISCYDKFYNHETMGELIIRRAGQSGVELKHSLEELLNESHIIISCVIARVAVEVAESAYPFLLDRHLFVDANAASPMVKEEVANIIQKKGALFVDAAMMGPIPTFLHRVPILASGNGAEEFQSVMSPYGMDITCLGDKPGQASAIKMFRSIFMKGYVALLLETLIASHKYSADEMVLDSIAETMDKEFFKDTARLLVTRGVIHAERRAFEMNEVIKTLKEINVSCTMSEATQSKLQWCSELRLKEFFKGEPPNTLKEVLAAIEK